MASPFCLPEIGEGIVEGEVVRWLVEAGQHVQAQDPVVEVMTDKATVEVAINLGGKVERLVAKEGEIVPVGGVLLELAGVSAAPDEPTKPSLEAVSDVVVDIEGVEPTLSPTPTPALPPTLVPPLAPAPAKKEDAPAQELVLPRRGRGTAAPDKVLASPAARAAARKAGIDIESVAAGPNGRVSRAEVADAARRLSQPPASPQGGLLASATVFQPLTPSGQEERSPLRGLRRRIAEQMLASTSTIPHFTYVDEVDMGGIVELRASLKAEAQAQGVRLTYLAFVALAARRALGDFPEVNAWHDDESGEVIVHPEMHLGISVDTPRGLYVGVVRDVGRQGLFELAGRIGDVVDRVREGKATTEELKGSTFTITSVGNIGGLFATPIINKPEVAILGMNRIVERPVVRDGAIVVRPMAYLSPSFDHRVVDGAVGARFVARLRTLLENPARIFLPEG